MPTAVSPQRSTQANVTGPGDLVRVECDRGHTELRMAHASPSATS